MKKQKLIVLLLFVLMGIGSSLHAQKVTKNFNSENLRSVLKEVEKQTNFSIIYETDELNEKKLITASFEDATIETVLNRILDANLKFTIEDKMIVIYPKDKTITASTGSSSTKLKNVTGTITDAGGEPLIGVTVKVKGTSVGTTTDFDGQFSLNKVPENALLEVSYIGMLPQSVSVADKSSFRLVMRDDTQQLEEVVVTAMGIERKAKSLTYATQKMDNEDLMRVQDANFVNSLQGKAAGLSITPNSGGAGGSFKILLRGNKSVYGNNMPLIVVDGIPMSNPVKGKTGATGGGASLEYSGSGEGSDALSSINPDDIESINILKGANAAALYGSAASNGVLMITTKKGKEGKLSIGFTSNATFEKPLQLPHLQNTYGAKINTGANTVSEDSWGKRITDVTPQEMAVRNMTNSAQDYASDFFNTGMTLNNSISLSGGTKNVLSYFSYGNTTANGMIENNTFNRHTLSFRQSYNLFNDYLKIDASINYLNQGSKNRPGGGKAYNPLYNLYTAPRNVDMNHYKNNYVNENGSWKSNGYSYLHLTPDGYINAKAYPTLKGPQQNWVFNSARQNNPYWLTNTNNNRSVEERVYGYLSANVKLFDGMTAQGRLSLDRSKMDYTTERSATTQGPSSMLDYGEYRHGLSNSNEFYLDWMLNYNKEFGDYSVSASGGYTAHETLGNSLSFISLATKEDPMRLIVPTVVNRFSPTSGLTGGRSIGKSIDWDEGLFVTGQFGIKDYLFFEGSYRHDWYRAFKQFNVSRNTPLSYGYYSFGVNALVHEMVSLPTFWNYFKVRTSYSEVGNSIPNLMYTSSEVDELTGAVKPSSYAYFENPIPEVTKSFEAGLDASFFKNALTWDLTFYNTTMLNNYLVVSESGKSKPVNSGVIRNRGIETTLAYALNISRDFIWKTGVNFSYNNNEILETYIDKDGKESIIEEPIGFPARVQLKYKKGGSYGDIYITDFERDAAGKIKLDAQGTPRASKDLDDRFSTYAGNMNAPVQLGWHNTFSYKDFSLYFLVDGRFGGKVISFTEAYLDYYGTSARTGAAREEAERTGLTFNGKPGMMLPDGQVTSVEDYYKGVGGEDFIASEYIYDATNFRMRELSLGYTFRNLFGNSKNLTLSMVGRNLFFLYNNAPIDPDTSLSTQNSLGNVDIFNMPSTRSLGLAVSVTF